MTFKDAAEYYNEINNKINDIHNTLNPILKQDTGPLGQYHIGSKDMANIIIYLNNYIKILKSKLEEEIK